MTVMIRRTPLMPRGGPGGVAIAALNSDKRIYIDREGDGTASKEAVRTEKIVRVSGATHTLSEEDDGATVVIDYSAGSCVVSLPATAKALRFTVIANALAGGGAGHAVSPVAADKITGNGFTPADDKDAILSAASDRVGDAIVLVGDGQDGWFIESVTGTWAREA